MKRNGEEKSISQSRAQHEQIVRNAIKEAVINPSSFAGGRQHFIWSFCIIKS